MVDAIHVADGVHAIAQGDVLDIELVARLDVECAGHVLILRGRALQAATVLPWAMRCASSSPVALAAAVMMSRLPE